MKKRLLAVFDNEESYIHKMIDYLSNKKNCPFEVKGFTNRQELLHFIQSTAIDILLVSINEMDDVLQNTGIKQIILLNDPEEITSESLYPIINKYQSADNLIKKVLEYCPIEEAFSCTKSDTSMKANIIGVYSPVNGCGKTTLALTLAYIYSKSCPALYINIEEFSGLSHLLNNDFPIDLSDLFYFYKQSPEKLSTKLISSIQSYYEIDFIPPTIYSYDLRNIEANEWKDFLNCILECSKYEVIIIDLSSMVKDIYMLLDLCKVLYMPVKSDRMSVAKLFEFEEFIRHTNREEILDKIKKIEIPVKFINPASENVIEHVMVSPLTNYIMNILKEGVVENSG